jgi:uncharacterized protein YbaA (DUF1428 family)
MRAHFRLYSYSTLQTDRSRTGANSIRAGCLAIANGHSAYRNKKKDLANLNNTPSIVSAMNGTDPARQGEEGSYLQITFCRVPKKNHYAVIQNAKQNDQLWMKHGTLRTESFQLGYSEIPGCDSIATTLSAAEDEEIWVLLQFFKDQDHWGEVMGKMMQDESVGPMVKEFESLTQGKRIITGGFDRLAM